MNINDFKYSMRRRMQVIAYRMTSPTFMSKVYFRLVLKKKLNLTAPKTFNEKIQLYKLKYVQIIKELLNALISIELEITLKKKI